MSYSQIIDPRHLPASSSRTTGPMKSFFSPAEPGRVKTPISSTRRRKILFSYLPDWILTIVLAAGFFALDAVDGFRREFSVQDTSLRHPYAVHERVPNLALYLICLVAPLAIQPIINLLTIRSWWDFHNGSLGLILGLALTGAVTQFTKITVGRPRPDILDRCQLPAGTIDLPFKLTNSTICTQTDIAILRDGFRSFPSGHSSLSFAGLGFLAFYLAGKVHLFDRRGHAGKAWLALTPFAGAALVAISRTMDFRHHWHDVLVGSLLGTVISYFTYRQYYPSLTSEQSHRPHSPRIEREEADTLPLHHRQPSSPGHDDPLQSHPLHPQAEGYRDPFSPPRPLGSELHPDGHQGYIDHSYELEGNMRHPTPRMGPTNM